MRIPFQVPFGLLIIQIIAGVNRMGTGRELVPARF